MLPSCAVHRTDSHTHMFGHTINTHTHTHKSVRSCSFLSSNNAVRLLSNCTGPFFECWYGRLAFGQMQNYLPSFYGFGWHSTCTLYHRHCWYVRCRLRPHSQCLPVFFSLQYYMRDICVLLLLLLHVPSACVSNRHCLCFVYYTISGNVCFSSTNEEKKE